ncbi:hypothetical protein VC83_05840 [Pseudogymnoascus destructans]|uniref:Uncharacterized protein n=2 Tax=Pseudogymnoascus destructans TaxID=655981 RepID=L8GA64_PSED2|nr:uncharacterized protein VC83_05840 [Pseudogymnoascus destructans]ELR08926.1 hypothetical protein GMDG_03593 [Pseudogymnoascus destructans 20631-21]OAF57232.1 hypothetical protein VC83_05840 [Pseudogymnoascus destructans]
MGMAVDNSRIGISHTRLLTKLQHAFSSQESALKSENTSGATRLWKGRRLQKTQLRCSDYRQSEEGCWKAIIPESTRSKIRQIFGGGVYEKDAGEVETAPFLSRH